MTTQNDVGTAGPRKRHPIADWAVKDLLLDAENPRLPPTEGIPSQEQLLILIVRTYSVGELMDSFAINGYFDEEPLVGVPDPDDSSKLIIVEGNRRLAALKILLDPSLTERLIDPISGRPLRVNAPPLSNDRREELLSVPVRVYEEGRSAVLAYLGYRHITGVKRWDSYAKARYVSQLVSDGNDLDSIQQKIGDRHETAPRLLRAYLVWEQADSLSMIPARNGHAPPFSYLFTALTFRPVLSFLGLAAQGMPKPVADANLPQLKEVSTYLYGDKEAKIEPAIEESREIQLLSKALSSPPALQRLRAGTKVRDAVEAIPAAEARLEKSIRQALEKLTQATELASPARANDSIKKLADDCVTESQGLVRALK
ncbi:MAG: hypothetical protein OXL97_05890 [Chloroflexota bacterium]|nr:hypothetical protein [Chloroflexota bacterium]MDE2885134.1 hypothetical protein [Chloroflexota bacterium]